MSAFVELPPELYDPGAFDGFALEFGVGRARALMWMAQLAYETAQPQTIEHAQRLWKLEATRPFAKRVIAAGRILDTRGVIAHRAGVTIVAFAGTDPAVLENLITDFKIKPAKTSDLHSGFANALDPVWSFVLETVGSSPGSLFLTGHSLGAALAVLAAERFHDAGLAPVGVDVFGMPRAGGATFAARYNAKLGNVTYRLVHGHDIVPTVPMSGLGFRHVGQSLSCTSGAKFDATALVPRLDSDEPKFTAGLFKALKERLLLLFRGQLLSPPGPGLLGLLFRYLPISIRDHLPDRYIDALSSESLLVRAATMADEAAQPRVGDHN